MKYIKKFEKLGNKFWIIPTDQPHLGFAFKKIGMSPSEVDHWVENWEDSGDEILVFQDYGGWSWSGLRATDDNGILFTKSPNYENMGRVYIEDHEVNADKYNI